MHLKISLLKPDWITCIRKTPLWSLTANRSCHLWYLQKVRHWQLLILIRMDWRIYLLVHQGGRRLHCFCRVLKGVFAKSRQPHLDADSVYEDVDATWADVNGDSYPDLVVASGGNEFYGNDKHLLPRLYINQQGKQLVRQDAFPQVQSTASCVVAFDFNSDGRPGYIPWREGCSICIWRNSAVLYFYQ